jgi:membrane protease YdiL (CAAX protease family)
MAVFQEKETAPPAETGSWPVGYTRALIAFEVIAVLALSVGQSAVYSLLSFLRSATAPQSLAQQQVALNAPAAPQSWLDLLYQIAGIAFGLAPVLLVVYLLLREGASLRTIGVDLKRLRWDLPRAAAAAAAIGIPGLALYLGAHAAGVEVTVVPTTLPDVWWRIPILVASAAQNGILEEVIWLGFLLRRFDRLGWSRNRSDLTSAVIRGSYHLYQGGGAFVGNIVMGLVFARLYRRWGRVMPLLIAHTLIDTVAFVGWVLFAGHLSWLPK